MKNLVLWKKWKFLYLKQRKEIVNNLVQNIENNLINGEEVIIENFGKLIKVEKPVKQTINPSNGETVEVPATTIIKFKPSCNLKLIMSDTKWTGIKYNKKTIETITIEEEQK
ncbi:MULTISPECIES: HU family DNA-binding protein [Mesoplasma]|uniref:HU family DNA-binding protein n=1 Tax=Mesoplasma TaxID=46239 RepID=UPI000A01DACE|nr:MULTISPECIES: HU family DNA-binding protein [Mesoplasma]